MGSPVSRRASASSSSPRLPSPWNEYGELRGLNAPPRSAVAPAARTALRRRDDLLLRLDGARAGDDRRRSGPPNETPGAIVTMVFSSRHSRETCLYGLLT